MKKEHNTAVYIQYILYILLQLCVSETKLHYRPSDRPHSDLSHDLSHDARQ